MIFQNPLMFIDPKERKKVLIFLLLAIIVIFIVFRFLDIPLQTDAAPSGIVSFEIAGSQEKAGQILASWDIRTKLFAAFGLGFDYLFMAVYAAFISLICMMASERHIGWFSRLGTWLGWGAYLAAIFDSIENIALWNLLSSEISHTWPILALWCATFKFILIISGVLYGIIGWVYPTEKNMKQKKDQSPLNGD